MSSSGVNVEEKCEDTFKQLMAGAIRYIIFKVDDKDIVVEVAVSSQELGVDEEDEDYKSNSKKPYEAFLKDLTGRTGGQDCRYAVFDFKFNARRSIAEGLSKAQKIVFIQLCPDNASVKKRMVYAASASAIKAALGTGKIIQIQASEDLEISHEEVLTKLVGKSRD